MKFAINAAAAALLLLASAPAFAHGGMGHMGGNMGGNMGASMGKTSHQTVVGRHDGDRHMHWRYTRTTKITGKIRTVRLKTLSPRQVLRIEREIGQLRLELFKLTNEGRGNSLLPGEEPGHGPQQVGQRLAGHQLSRPIRPHPLPASHREAGTGAVRPMQRASIQ